MTWGRTGGRRDSVRRIGPCVACASALCSCFRNYPQRRDPWVCSAFALVPASGRGGGGGGCGLGHRPLPCELIWGLRRSPD